MIDYTRTPCVTLKQNFKKERKSKSVFLWYKNIQLQAIPEGTAP